MSRDRSPGESVRNVLRGMLRLATGRADGFAEIGNTPAAFSASIAPLIAFPLVGAGLLAIQHHWQLAVSLFLSRFCGVLTQPVIVEFASGRIGGRTRNWLATSTALNWSIWLIFPLIPAGALVSGALVGLGLSQEIAVIVTIGLIGAYMLWLQWFILRHGLFVGRWRAAALLVVMNITIAALYLVPYLFHPGLMHITVKTPSG